MWQDRFRAPTAIDLIEGIDKPVRATVVHARNTLVKDRDIQERVAWQGVWKWTLTYRHVSSPDRAWAYIVPDPAKPRVCVPMPDAALNLLPVKSTPKYVRESLAFAPVVDGVRWPVWDLPSRQQVDDVLGLLRSKLEAALELA
ncbi:MAG: hypothetical protein JSR77_12230 [Planctomycetes bacterium]|nr:hypothetical protein [Planctomycetota bacterium]